MVSPPKKKVLIFVLQKNQRLMSTCFRPSENSLCQQSVFELRESSNDEKLWCLPYLTVSLVLLAGSIFSCLVSLFDGILLRSLIRNRRFFQHPCAT